MNNIVTCTPNGDGTSQISAFYGGKTLEWVISSRLFTQRGYYDGAVIDGDDIDELQRLAETTKAIKKGLYLLSFSDMSKGALSKKLCTKGFERSVADDACVYLQQAGYINEEAHALRVGRAAVKDLRGRLSVAEKLTSKGFERKYIKRAMAQIEEETDFAEILRLYIEKKNLASDIMQERTSEGLRAVRAILRRGFTYGDISEYKSNRKG